MISKSILHCYDIVCQRKGIKANPNLRQICDDNYGNIVICCMLIRKSVHKIVWIIFYFDLKRELERYQPWDENEAKKFAVNEGFYQF